MDSTVTTSEKNTYQKPLAETSFDFAFIGVLGCFFLSGFAALLYETAWMRLFSIAFGTSELSVAAVLAIYMAGLAIGAALAGRFVSRLHRPVLVYGLLELGIAVSAMAVPFGLSVARQLLVVLVGGQSNPPDAGGMMQALFFLAASFIIIIVPTSMMGATLPLLTRFCIHNDEQVGRRTGYLYSINTAGAVAGTLTSAFILLPRIGLTETVYLGVTVNALVFVLAVLLARHAKRRKEDTMQTTSTDLHSSSPLPDISHRAVGGERVILLLMLASGFVSFTYEVLWTRLLGHLLGGSVYAFATMLAGFLTGITIGSAVAAQLARTRTIALKGFVVAQIGTAVLSILIYRMLNELPALAARFSTGGHISLAATAALTFLVLLPATLCIGATFPFAVRIFAHDVAEAGPASAIVYAWNTIGAIFGALLAGFVLLPTLEFALTVRLAVAVNMLIALTAAVKLFEKSFATAAMLVMVFFAAAFLYQPTAPENLMRSSSFSPVPAQGKLMFSAVGTSSTVLLLNTDGFYRLLNNGLPEASIFPKGYPLAGRHPDLWHSALPVVARPDAQSMLIIGLGGGMSIEGVPPTVKSIDVIELEPEVIAANRLLAPLRLHDPLSDPRVRLITNDARGALSLTNKKYDIIISQPSHPWTAGASHLYTREFFAEICDHLNDGGVFLQWMNINMIDESLFKTLTATVLDAFDYARLYRPFPTVLLFLSSNEPIEPEKQLAMSGEPLRSSRAHYGQMGIHGVEEICRTLAVDQPGLESLSAGAPVNTDGFNRLAMHSSSTGTSTMTIESLDRLTQPFDPLVDRDSKLLHGSSAAVDARRLASLLVLHGDFTRAYHVAMAHLDEADQTCVKGCILEAIGNYNHARQAFSRVLEFNPNHSEALFKLLRLSNLPPQSPKYAELVGHLSDPAKAIIEQMPNRHSGHWKEVAAVDERLAAGQPGGTFSADAAHLRAEWRVKLEDTEHRKQWAQEAIDIIDYTVQDQRDIDCLFLRFLAGGIVDRPEIQVETAAVLAEALGNRSPATNSSGEEPEQVNDCEQIVLTRLTELLTDSRVARDRVQEVAAKYESLARRPSHQHSEKPDVTN